MFEIAAVSYIDHAAPAKFTRCCMKSYASRSAFINSEAKFEWVPTNGAGRPAIGISRGTPGMMVIIAGDMLDLATRGHYPAGGFWPA